MTPTRCPASDRTGEGALAKTKRRMGGVLRGARARCTGRPHEWRIFGQRDPPLGPAQKRQRSQESGVNPTSWQLGNLNRCPGSRSRRRRDTRNADATDRRSTSRPAKHEHGSGLLSSTRFRPTALQRSLRANSPRPTPARSREHRAIRSRSERTNPPEPSAHGNGPCGRNHEPSPRCSSHPPAKSSSRSEEEGPPCRFAGPSSQQPGPGTRGQQRGRLARAHGPAGSRTRRRGGEPRRRTKESR